MAPPQPLPASYAQLVGDEPATLGPAIAGLHFGDVIDPEKLPHVTATTFGFLGETAPRHLGASTDPGPKTLVNLEIRGGKLFAFKIELLSEAGAIPPDSCADVGRSLEAKWGASPDRIWIDRAAHVRAALRDTCILIFERYVEPTAWIGPEPASIVPVSAVGKAAKELAPRVGPEVKLDEDVTYRDVGVGEHATGPTTVDVYVKKGVVSGFAVETAAGTPDRVVIRDRISAAFSAKPTRDAVTGYDVWATTPPIRMLETQTGVRIEAGKLAP